jgi:acetyltransferase-like isoleucine patch superfamily enzyme
MAEPLIKNSRIYEVEFGEDVKIIEPVNMYGCHIGSKCFIGPFVEIQSSVRIGERTKIQSHSFICEMVEIGYDCFIGHGVMFINDKFSWGGPANGDRNLWFETKVANRVSIGSNSTILPVAICNDVVIGAGSVVTKNITEPGIYLGNPARLTKRFYDKSEIS